MRVSARKAAVIKYAWLSTSALVGLTWLASIWTYFGWDSVFTVCPLAPSNNSNSAQELVPPEADERKSPADSQRLNTFAFHEGTLVLAWRDPSKNYRISSREWLMGRDSQPSAGLTLPSYDPTFPLVRLPLWCLFVPCVLATIVAFRRLRPPGPGCCITCGYNLTGNESRRCPECGASVADQTVVS